MENYKKFFARIDPRDLQAASVSPLLIRAAEQLLDNAMRGLDAYAALPPHIRIRPNIREARKELEQHRNGAAVLFLTRRDHREPLLEKMLQTPPQAGADVEAVMAYRSSLGNALEQYRSDLKRTGAAQAVVLNVLQRGEISRVGAEEANFWAVCHQTFDSRRIMDLTTLRLLSHRDELSPALSDALEAHVQLLQTQRKDYDGAYAVMMRFNVNAQALPEALKAMENVHEQLAGSGEQLCLAAAREIESGCAKWQLALECADAVRILTSSLRAFMQRAEQHVAERPAVGSSSALPSSVEAAQPSDPTPRTSGAVDAAAASTSRRRRPGRRPAPASRPHEQAPTPPPDRLSLVASRARHAMAMSRRLTRDMAVRDEPAAVARALGHDTSTIDLLRRHKADPIYIASTIRSSLPKWFGADELSSANLELTEVSAGNPMTPELADLAAQTAERIDALKLMQQRVTADEIDAIKQYPLPKEIHLERLRKLRQIAHVGSPAILPSQGDTATQGRLFEMVIRPTPLVEGSPAPAFYLHLHTEKPMSVEAMRKLSRDKFAAVHVKTEEQKNLGSKWEQMWLKRGYEEKVHRGTVGARMLDKLLQMAK